jgi:hypothetical protein
MLVTKANGEKEEFSKKKIERTCHRAGVDRKTASEIAGKIEKQVREDMRTKEIYKMILQELDKRDNKSSLTYRLRDAVSKIDSENFEKFIDRMLGEYGYKCDWNKIIRGKIIEHQVDVTASAQNRDSAYIIECKHHRNPHRDCGLGEVMEVWARLEDLQQGGQKFSKAWLITNTKFSMHAKKYAEGKGVKLTGWNYRGADSLQRLLEDKKLYPVTILKLNQYLIGKLMKNGFLVTRDVCAKKLIEKGFNVKEIENIVKQINIIDSN